MISQVNASVGADDPQPTGVQDGRICIIPPDDAKNVDLGLFGFSNTDFLRQIFRCNALSRTIDPERRALELSFNLVIEPVHSIAPVAQTLKHVITRKAARIREVPAGCGILLRQIGHAKSWKAAAAIIATGRPEGLSWLIFRTIVLALQRPTNRRSVSE